MAGLSKKQLQILRFPYTGKTALICDGAVRSGKTSMMSLGFLLWAMSEFQGCYFGICGKTIAGVERNVLNPLLGIAYLNEHFSLHYVGHLLTVSRGKKVNYFYLFGGKDESSYTQIQGVTLAGVLLDEVVLMPRSFVEQALARCSVEGARFWFNCNPAAPGHWFYREWILGADKHDATHVHFTMRDNPSLSRETIARYESLYAGVFHARYIEGKWVASDGVIYDMFDRARHVYEDAERPQGLPYLATRHIAVDYGTTNPCVFLDIYDDGDTIWVDREYRWDSRAQGGQKTDAEYTEDLAVFMGTEFPCAVVCDPSAASFITALRQRGQYVVCGNNAVLAGIRHVSALFAREKIKIHESCIGLIDEMTLYAWDTQAAEHGEERPIKVSDHGADALRYYCMTVAQKWRKGEVNE